LTTDAEDSVDTHSVFFTFPWQNHEAVNHIVLVRMRHRLLPRATLDTNELQWTLYFLVPETATPGPSQAPSTTINPSDVLLEALAAFNAIITDDSTTYEELTRLQELMGFVNRGVSLELINGQLPSISYQKGACEAEGTSCTICLHEYKSEDALRKLPCKHSYHLECIDRWLLQVNQCPLCRQEAVIKPPET